MRLKSVLIITLFVTVSVESGNKRRRRDEGRQGRLFSFNTIDNDISVDLDFSIPFIKIPVKRTMESGFGLSEFPTININPASLALGGAVVLGAGIMLPFFLKSYAHQTDGRYSRLLNNAEFGADAMMDFAQRMASDSQGFGGCPLRIACLTVQRDLADPQVILNQIVTNRLLSTMVNSSAVEDAMVSGRHGRDCASYGHCPVQDHHVQMLVHQLAVLSDRGFRIRP